MDFRLNICDLIMCILLTRESLTEAVIFQASSGDGRRQGPGRLRRVFQTQGTGCYQTLSQGEDGGRFAGPGKGMCGWSTELEGEVKGDAVGSRAWPCGSGSRQRRVL